MKTIVQGPGHVAKNELDGLQVLHRGLFHESAHVSDRERQVRPGVHKVPEAADKPPVVRGVHLLSLALPAQAELLLHGRVHQIAAGHLAVLEDPPSIVSLAKGDATGILTHLDAEVEAEQAEVAHVESFLHLRLEAH